MGRKNYQALIVFVCCCISSCVKDKPPAVHNTTVTGTAGNVYVVCEGAYSSGNASLYVYNPANDSVYGDIYQQANNQPVGDVFQSMIKSGGNFFLCVNNSNKVTVINSSGYQLVATINVPQPRYILQVSSSKAYVSSLYHNKVFIINTQTNTLTDSITLPYQNTEGMCLYNNNAVICTWDTAGNHIYLVDGTTNAVIKTIKVAGRAPQSVLVDKEQMLWVLAGDQPEGKTATWTRIDPTTGEILISYTFPAAADPLEPVFNNTKDTLYFIEANYNLGTTNNGIYRMGIHDVALPAQPLIPAAQNQYFYALGISPATGL
jgi:DNA-binding beta-propeller fold protein YncE